MSWNETIVPVIAKIDTDAPPFPQSGIAAEQDILASFPRDEYGDYEKRLIALYTQTHHGSQGMNSYLRGALPVDPQVPHNCRVFQETISKYTLPHAVNVLRGVKNDGLIPDQPVAGTTITNYGFTSTSFDPTIPEQFATGLGPVGIGATRYIGATSPIIFDIHVPQGFPCLPVSGLVESPAALAEHELILPDATKFHIMADFSAAVAGVPMRILKVVALPPTRSAGPPPRQPVLEDTGDDHAGRLLGDSTSMNLHAAEPQDAMEASQALQQETKTAKTAGWWSDHFNPDEKRDGSGKWTADDAAPRAESREDRFNQERQIMGDATKLNSHALKAMQWYQNDGVAAINGFLRGTGASDGSTFQPGEGWGYFAKDMQKALLNNPLSHSCDVLRGAPSGFGDVNRDSMVGKTIVNHGFVSTSFDPQHAEEFMRGNGVLFDIHVPKGTHGYPIEAMKDSRISEHELLLPHGTQFHVTGDEIKTVHGHRCRVLKCEASDPEGDMRKAKPVKTAAYDPSEQRANDGKWTAGGKSESEVKDFLDGIGGQEKSPEQIQYALKSFMHLNDADAKAHAEHYKSPAPAQPAQDDSWASDTADFDKGISQDDPFNADPSPIEKEIGGPDWDHLEDGDLSAVSDYVGGAYEAINQMLRGKGAASPRMLDTVKRINKIMDNYQLPKPVEVMRGIGSGALPRGRDLTGKNITLKGLTSTSFDPSVVTGFMSGLDQSHAIMDIKVPAGTHCMPTGGLHENSDEHELVLPHGTKLKVIGESQRSIDGSPMRVVHCEMVPQKEPRSRKKADFDPGEKRDNSGEWTSDENKPSVIERTKALVPHAHAIDEIKKDIGKGLDLSDAQHDAIKDYTSSDPRHSFAKINLYMRNREKFKDKYGQDTDEPLDAHVKALSTAIDSYRMPVDAHLIRGVTNSSGWLPPKLKGKTITNHGFASTSLTPMVGEVFSIGTDRDNPKKYKPGVVMDIYTPKGFHALPAFAAGADVAKEDEVILPDQCRFFIADDQTDTGGTRRLRCIAMPPKAEHKTSARESQPRSDVGTWAPGGGPSTERDAGKFLREHYGEYRDTLPSLQSKAALLYASPLYVAMNELLRGTPVDEVKKLADATDRDITMAGIASLHLHQAILNSPPIKKPLTVFRQMGSIEPPKKNDVLTEDGFTSTSLINNNAMGLGTTAEIRLPIGTKALGGLSREMILPPGARFKVVQTSRRGDRPHYVMTYLIPGVPVQKSAYDDSEKRDESGKWTSGSMTARRGPSQRFDPISTEGWQKVGGQKGSNPGGMFKDHDGGKWYVKASKSEKHARNEALAAELYNMAGVDVPDVRLTRHNGKLGTASKMVDGAKQDLLERMDEPEYRKAAQDGFAAHAWLGNWDAVGLEYDNIMSDKDGKPVMIDPGGSLLYRAQGGEKGDAFSNDVSEWDSLRNPSRNTGSLFHDMSKDQLKKSVQHIADMSPDAISDAVKRAGFDPQTEKFVAGRLIKRREDLMKKAHIKISAVEPDPYDLNADLLARTSGMALQVGDHVDATVIGMYWGTGTIDDISTSDYGGTKLFPAYHVTSDDGQNDWFPPIALTKING